MKRETQLAVGIVAGVLLLAAGGFWLTSDSGDEIVDVPSLPVEEALIPAYDEYGDKEQAIEPEIDDMAGDVTRIVIRSSAMADDVDIDQVLTGKVVIDGQVVQQSGVE